MSKQNRWKPEDGVAFRQFLAKTPREKISEIMADKCPAVIDAATILDKDADAVSRLAAMKAGWEAYEKELFALSESSTSAPEIKPGFEDMQ